MKTLDLFRENQEHLTDADTVMLGSYYTPKHIVELVYKVIQKNIPDYQNITALDSSAGYGNFLKSRIFKRQIASDIDEIALSILQKNATAEIHQINALQNVLRKNYNIADSEKLLIIGNPPYNDTTSYAKKNIKQENKAYSIDTDIKARDIGSSFLMSYNKLKADYVCVLHPLSFLIKKTNFASLRSFTANYKLIDAVVFSSKEFKKTSTASQFPIAIALYKRDDFGMDFEYIKKYKFQTIDDKVFAVNDFDYIENYISKYPNKDKGSDIMFWTMRDINALRRNQTFIKKDCANAIYVPQSQLHYYCYVDVLKDYIRHIPYYLGNLSIPIDNDNFIKLYHCFVAVSANRHSLLRQHCQLRDCYHVSIKDYFKNLFATHYVY